VAATPRSHAQQGGLRGLWRTYLLSTRTQEIAARTPDDLLSPAFEAELERLVAAREEGKAGCAVLENRAGEFLDPLVS
jgi:hypothetical protein